MPYISVVTATYNRADLLDRPFDSLMEQTFTDFEWIVIDDGSTDDTETVIERFKANATFPITYIKKENGGRASALNESYKYVNAKYVLNVDSDDALLPEALQILHDAWENIPSEEYDRFWCVTGHCIDNTNHEIIGRKWPEGINSLKGRKQLKTIYKYKQYKDKMCCRKIDVLKANQFPVLPNTKFVPEDMVWEKINGKYDQYCINDILRIYYVDTVDRLGNPAEVKSDRRYSYYFFTLFFINDCFDRFFFDKRVPTAICQFSRQAIKLGIPYKQAIRDVNGALRKTLVTIGWPLMLAYNLVR